MGKELQKGRRRLEVIDVFILLVVVKVSQGSKCAVYCTQLCLDKAVKESPLCATQFFLRPL